MPGAGAKGHAWQEELGQEEQRHRELCLFAAAGGLSWAGAARRARALQLKGRVSGIESPRRHAREGHSLHHGRDLS